LTPPISVTDLLGLLPPIPTGPVADGDDMQQGEVLYPGQSISSASGAYVFVYQDDGNLVLYSSTEPLWASNTAGSSPGVCIMQYDGDLVIYDLNGQPNWDSGTSDAGSRLSVNSDGRVQIFNPSSQEIWSTHWLGIPFRFGMHNLTVGNPNRGSPDWGMYEDTFGAKEVWHELLDPIFGHPILTALFFLFYEKFLKMKGNGGLATGHCSALSSLVADNFCQGKTDTNTIQLPSIHRELTALMGKLLSRESLLHFHDQSREGIARVEKTFREIEATFLQGTNRNNAPLLFFIPSGPIWDGVVKYFDTLGETHCVMPYRIKYPAGRPGPTVSTDGSSVTTDPDKVELFVWDCNHDTNETCNVVFQRGGDNIDFSYSHKAELNSQNDFTLGMMTNGRYKLSDHDLPFGGPYGVTTFIIDLLLSPADLQVTDANGLRTGNFGGKILSEIPGSQPCYLAKGAYMLPEHTPLTRTIVGQATGTYQYASITPDATSVSISGISTANGQEDVLSLSPDATQVRFVPAVEKTFSISLGRKVGDQVRAIAITGAGGGPGKDMDITVSPEMSAFRMGNRGSDRMVNVKSFAFTKSTNTPVNKQITGFSVPKNHHLAVSITDWAALNLKAEKHPF
jgi:hypothetical protein